MRQNLPKCHPDVFSGDFAMFHAWKKAFQAMIYDAEISPEQEINYLHKYTSGEPQKLIDNYRKRIDGNQFKVIKELWSEMERRFGNVAAITNALLQRLEDASRFGDKDAKKLQEFSDLCDNASDQMKQLPGLKCLNYPNVIRPLVMKLPGHLQRKWDERVVEFASTNYDLYPDFEVFAREVRKYARLKNHPNVTVYENVRTDIPRSGRKDRYKDEDHRILKGNTESPSPSSEEKTLSVPRSSRPRHLRVQSFRKEDFTTKIGLDEKVGSLFSMLR